MTRYRRALFQLLLLLAASTWAEAQSVVISDTLSGAKGAPLEDRWPDTTNLPGGTWKVVAFDSSGTLGASLANAAGIPAPLAAFTCAGNSSGAILLPISSQGAYVKPAQFTISAGLGAFTGGVHPLLGFYSALPEPGKAGSVVEYFTGLKLVCNGGDDPANGTLVLYQNGAEAASVKYTGTFDSKALHRLSYDVDTASGAISNVSLQGSSSDYSVFHTAAFTNAATAYAGIGAASFARDNLVYADNFKIVAGKGVAALLPNTSLPAPPTGLTAIKGRDQWNSIRLDWNKSFGNYSVYRGTSAGGESPTPIADGLVTPTYVDTNLADGATYYYKVKATNPYGSSDSNETSLAVNNPLYRDLTAYPPFSLNWTPDTSLQRVRGVYPHPSLSSRALVTTQTGLLLTDDDGHTWTNLPEAAVEKVGPINDIAFHPILADTFYIASRTKGVWVTTDEGKTFTQIGAKAKGMAADTVTSIIIYTGDSTHRTLLAAHGDAAAGLSRSLDGGQTWDVVNTDYHFSRLIGGEGDTKQFYLFGSTVKEPDIQSVYTGNTVGEYVSEVVRDVVPTDLVFAPVPFRQDSLTYLTTSDSGLYCIDNTSQFGMAYNVTKLPYPGVDGWASLGVTWGPSAEVLHLFLYDPTKLGLVVATEKLANQSEKIEDITQSVIASDGLPVSPLTGEGAVLRPNANGTVCYATANGALSIGRMPGDVPEVDFHPSAFEISSHDEQDRRDLIDAFAKFNDSKSSTVDAAKALCLRVPDLESFYRSHQITVTARVPVKPAPPRSVTLDLSRYGGSPDTPLYDDGRHGDGAAGDGVYGGTFAFLPVDHRPHNEDPEWRCVGPGRIAMGVDVTYADGRRRGAVGVVNYLDQLLDLDMWSDGPGSATSDVEGGVTTETFLNPLAPGQLSYQPRRHKGDVAVRLQIPKGPWAVHFKMAYNRHNIDGYAGLSLFLRLEAGAVPGELYLQLRDDPEFSPPTTTERVPILNGLALNADFQRVSVPMSRVLGPGSSLKTDHLAEIILAGDSAAPATLVVDGLAAIPYFPPPNPPDSPR